jgi:hypothetical protein
MCGQDIIFVKVKAGGMCNIHSAFHLLNRSLNMAAQTINPPAAIAEMIELV